MKSDDIISVIIPVYNVEQYIDTCVKSVTEQSYKDLEIILVDDGSTDNSGVRCDEWSKRDSRIKVIHKENDGLNNARKSGWEASTGSYVTFLDSDDLMHNRNIEWTRSIMISHNTDAVVYSFKEFSDHGHTTNTLKIQKLSGECRKLDDKESIARYSLLGDKVYPNNHYMTVWGKLYKRKLVQNVNWKESNYWAFEDNFWTPQALLSADSILLICDQLLLYRRNVQYGDRTHDILSSKLVGNTFNGAPVGYLELVKNIKDYYIKLQSKYNIKGLDEELNEIINANMRARIDNLIRSRLLCDENNLKYLSDYINEINDKISKLGGETEHLNIELSRLKGLKASTRLLASNIKRKLR